MHLGNNTTATYWEIPSSQQDRSKSKRGADDAFGQNRQVDYGQREVYGSLPDEQAQNNNANGVQDLSTRLMAHMLGLEMPGVERSTSFFPGYEWWPRANQGYPQPPPQQATQQVPFSGQGSDHDLLGNVSDPSMVAPELDWTLQTMAAPGPQVPSHMSNININYPYDFQQYGT